MGLIKWVHFIFIDICHTDIFILVLNKKVKLLFVAVVAPALSRRVFGLLTHSKSTQIKTKMFLISIMWTGVEWSIMEWHPMESAHHPGKKKILVLDAKRSRD